MIDLAEVERLKAEAESAKAAYHAARKALLLASDNAFGADGIRDPDAPCSAFVNGTPERGADCETDGHYLCDECKLRASCPCGCGKRPSRCASEEGP